MEAQETLNRKRRKGFTLLEVILTIMLMVTGSILLLQALATGLFATAENENDLVAINLAQEKMEGIRNTSYAGIANEIKAVVSSFPAFQREVVVDTLQSGLKKITVNVYWSSKSAELNQSLVTYISDTQ